MKPEDRRLVDALAGAQLMMIETGTIGVKQLTETPYHTNLYEAFKTLNSTIEVDGSETKDWKCFVTYLVRNHC